MSDGMQMRRLGEAIDKLFTYETHANATASPKDDKKKEPIPKKQSHPKQSAARG